MHLYAIYYYRRATALRCDGGVGGVGVAGRDITSSFYEKISSLPGGPAQLKNRPK